MKKYHVLAMIPLLLMIGFFMWEIRETLLLIISFGAILLLFGWGITGVMDE